MSLRAFWYAAEAFRVEEGVSFVTPGPQRAARPPDVAKQNAAAMQQMMGLMGGVQKGRRR